MLNYLRNLFIFPVVKKRLSSNLRIQTKTILNSLNHDIAASILTNDSSLDEQDYKKITDYYGLAVPVMIGESFCILRGEKMSDKERLALTYLGGLTGLFDDFFDRKDMPESYIKTLLQFPQNITGADSSEKLILKLYLKALDQSADSDRLKRYSFEVYEAQVLSKLQTGSQIGNKEILNITIHKGGNSVLFYLNSFKEELSCQEKNLFYKLGGIWQIENDLLDVYKDLQHGVKTLVTTENKINNIRVLYIRMFNELVFLLQQTTYSKANKKRFLDSITLFISIGHVALDVLEKNEKKTNGLFQPEKYERKDLICDIEKPVNIIKTVHYFAKYNPAFPVK